MKSLILVSLCLILIISVAVIWLFRRRHKKMKRGYQRATTLFSLEERRLFWLLRETVGDQFEIFGKIPVGEIISPRMDNRGQNLPGEYEDLAGQYFSLVLCDRRDLSVAAALELHNDSVGSRRSPAQNSQLQALCTAAGLPLIAIHAAALDAPSELRAQVLGSLTQVPLPLPQAEGRKEPRISSIEGLDLD